MVLENINFLFKKQNLDKPSASTEARVEDIALFGAKKSDARVDGQMFNYSSSDTELEGFTRTTPQTDDNQPATSEFATLVLDKPYKKGKIVKNFTNILKQETIDEKAKLEIMKSVKSINADNFSSVLRESETILGVNPPILKILNSNAFSTQEKKEMLQHLMQQGIARAEKDGVHTEDFIDKLKANVDKFGEKSTNNDKAFIVADFRKLVDRNKPDKSPVKTNGQVDRRTSQGKAGDCWFLATINAYTSSPEGKKYLNECISKDEATGNITVTLKGVNKTYVITQEEINDHTNYSSGDGDVRAFEIAAQKFFEETPISRKADVYGNSSNIGLLFLSESKNIAFTRDKDEIKEFTDRMASDRNFKPVAVTAILSSSAGPVFEGVLPDGQTKVTVGSGHAYTLAEVHNNDVYLIDPNNSDERIKISLDQYLAFFNNLSYVDLNDKTK